MFSAQRMARLLQQRQGVSDEINGAPETSRFHDGENHRDIVRTSATLFAGIDDEQEDNQQPQQHVVTESATAIFGDAEDPGMGGDENSAVVAAATRRRATLTPQHNELQGSFASSAAQLSNASMASRGSSTPADRCFTPLTPLGAVSRVRPWQQVLRETNDIWEVMKMALPGSVSKSEFGNVSVAIDLNNFTMSFIETRSSSTTTSLSSMSAAEMGAVSGEFESVTTTVMMEPHEAEMFACIFKQTNIDMPMQDLMAKIYETFIAKVPAEAITDAHEVELAGTKFLVCLHAGDIAKILVAPDIEVPYNRQADCGTHRMVAGMDSQCWSSVLLTSTSDRIKLQALSGGTSKKNCTHKLDEVTELDADDSRRMQMLYGNGAFCPFWHKGSMDTIAPAGILSTFMPQVSPMRNACLGMHAMQKSGGFHTDFKPMNLVTHRDRFSIVKYNTKLLDREPVADDFNPDVDVILNTANRQLYTKTQSGQVKALSYKFGAIHAKKLEDAIQEVDNPEELSKLIYLNDKFLVRSGLQVKGRHIARIIDPWDQGCIFHELPQTKASMLKYAKKALSVAGTPAFITHTLYDEINRCKNKIAFLEWRIENGYAVSDDEVEQHMLLAIYLTQACDKFAMSLTLLQQFGYDLHRSSLVKTQKMHLALHHGLPLRRIDEYSFLDRETFNFRVQQPDLQMAIHNEYKEKNLFEEVSIEELAAVLKAGMVAEVENTQDDMHVTVCQDVVIVLHKGEYGGFVFTQFNREERGDGTVVFKHNAGTNELQGDHSGEEFVLAGPFGTSLDVSSQDRIKAAVKKFEKQYYDKVIQPKRKQEYNTHTSKIHAFVQKYVYAAYREEFKLLVSDPHKYLFECCYMVNEPGRVTPKPFHEITPLHAMIDWSAIEQDELGHASVVSLPSMVVEGAPVAPARGNLVFTRRTRGKDNPQIAQHPFHHSPAIRRGMNRAEVDLAHKSRFAFNQPHDSDFVVGSE